MRFLVGHGFIQGDNHPICQDYAISALICGQDLSVAHNPLIIVTDGCSSVPDSDVGARIVAWSARRIIERLIADRDIPDHYRLAELILRQTLQSAASLNVPRMSCAATLMIGFVLDGVCHIYIFGDGVWFCRSKTGELKFTSIETVDPLSQSPPYLILDALPNHREIVLMEWPSEECTISHEKSFHWSFDATTISEFGLASDGIAATSLSTEQLIQTLTGNRVEYQINQFLNNIHQTPMYLRDDIAIATIRIDCTEYECLGREGRIGTIEWATTLKPISTGTAP